MKVTDRFGSRILGREVKLGPFPEQRPESLLEFEAGIAIPRQCRQADRHVDAVVQALPDCRLEGAVRGDLENDIRPEFVQHCRNRIGEQDRLPDVRPPI